MKSIKKGIVVVLVLVLLLTGSVPDSVIASEKSFKPTILYRNSDEKTGTREESTRAYEDTVLYVFTNKEISYCAQMTTYGKIQFSYALGTSGDIMESPAMEIDTIYKKYNLDSKEDADYVLLNRRIVDTLGNYDVKKSLSMDNDSIAPGEKAQPYGSLEAAVSAVFGSNYIGVLKGFMNKTLNGTSYIISCKESQTTSTPSMSSQNYAKETFLTVVITWVVLGGMEWAALLDTIIQQAIETIIKQGLRVLKKATNVTKTNVTIMRTRRVSVDGVSGTQYYAGWTRKRYFLGGNKGWIHDSGNNYNYKHSDYDSVSTLLDKGWNSFVNGGY